MKLYGNCFILGLWHDYKLKEESEGVRFVANGAIVTVDLKPFKKWHKISLENEHTGELPKEVFQLLRNALKKVWKVA